MNKLTSTNLQLSPLLSSGNNNRAISADKPRKNPSYYPEPLAKTHNGKIGTETQTKPGNNSYQSPRNARPGNGLDNRYQINKAKWGAVLSAGATLSCTVGYIGGMCKDGHTFLKTVYCGREWCINCGEDGSPAHQRRIARWLPKVAQMPEMGYYVITIPDFIREGFNDKKELTAFRTFIKRKFQRLGYNRGLIRWHSFGDCGACKGAGDVAGKDCQVCEGTGAGRKYNPHLNILIDDGYIDMNGPRWDSIVNELKKSCSNYFRKRFPGLPGKHATGIVNYSYADNEPHKMHKLKYVTRSTFRIFNAKYAETWKGYRITSTWGKWDKPETTAKDNLALLENGFCPVCNTENKGKQKVTWYTGHNEVNTETGEITYKRDIIKRKEFQAMGYHVKHMAAGYYFVMPEISCEVQKMFVPVQLDLFTT